MIPSSELKVVREGKLWGVSVDGEVLALARSKGAAEALARDACRILRDSGAEARIADEPRSFRKSD
jgi:hypothetical protein